ncbi:MULTISPECIES: PP2C family protein-serine/threonine phosphatase [Methylomonas]|uniref:PP2C family protein-serine/threonine phosphatase n=1 Tax=Methylomonas TaxID=416 RepID=UPI0012322CB6|nr:PP2C family serine/threonine-protein phosphatase [Methylomonas rhizoryzae]
MQEVLEFYQLTSAGDRSVNQDCMAHRVCSDYAVFIVADGLGGHQAGEKASQYFCRSVLSLAASFQPRIAEDIQTVFGAWMNAAASGMRKLFADDNLAADAHTTCAILYLDDARTVTAHCGDSRIYRLTPDKIVWRSRDHSRIQQLYEEGKLTGWEMGVHPEQNRLTRSINALTPPYVDVEQFQPILPGETFILCSDGFWESIKESELLQLAQPSSGKAELRKLAQLAILRSQGRSDNCTVQWIRRKN